VARLTRVQKERDAGGKDRGERGPTVLNRERGEREVGAGARLRPAAASCAREKGRLEKEKKLAGGPRLSATGERGGGRG